MSGPIYEVVFMTEEAYYSVGWFAVKAEADQVVTTGNAALLEAPDQWHGFETRERPVLAGAAPWSANDIKIALTDHIYDFEDWFRSEPEEEDDATT